jgi:hypothetical protein
MTRLAHKLIPRTPSKYRSMRLGPCNRRIVSTYNMIRIPHVMAHCWAPTARPRMCGGANSLMYTGTCADSMPTARPLMMRPAMSMPTFWEAETMAEPRILSN